MRSGESGRPLRQAMARHRREVMVGALHVADVMAIAAAIYAADYLRFHLAAPGAPLPHLPHDQLAQCALMAAAAFIPALWAFGLYQLPRGWTHPDLVFRTFASSCLGVMGFLSLSYLVKEFSYSRLMVWVFAVLVWTALLAERLAVARILSFCFRMGFGVLRIVIVGDSPSARTLSGRILKNPHGGLRVVGHLLAASGGGGNGGRFGRLEDAFEEVRRSRAHVCLFAEPVHGNDEMTYLLARCQEEGIGVWLATDLQQRYSPRMELVDVESAPVIVVGSLRLARWERLLKRATDVAVAISILLASAPVMIYIALRIRRELGSPAIFRQVRVGFQGRTFTIFKFRAVPDRRGPAAASRASEAPPFCEFLRRYSLDEIPQLWNVLRSDMSLVGPRPETPERVRRYSPWNRRRLQVKPGITGLAQIAGVRGEHDFETKSGFDVRYVENQTFLLDLRILARTPLVVWRRRSGDLRLRPLAGMEGRVGEEETVRC